jgi:prepilin-type N-terminal cleavage/methylation domain-containing protein
MIKNKSGFTIVELLIVIVVIAILAAITIVAYNGIQNRAMDTKIKNLAASVGKSLLLERIDGVTPAAVGYWGNANGVDSIITPKYQSAGYRDDLKSSNADFTSRIFRYYVCASGGFVIYASLNSPTSGEIQNFQDTRTQCGQTVGQAPDTAPLIYNYARIFN